MEDFRERLHGGKGRSIREKYVLNGELLHLFVVLIFFLFTYPITVLTLLFITWIINPDVALETMDMRRAETQILDLPRQLRNPEQRNLYVLLYSVCQ